MTTSTQWCEDCGTPREFEQPPCQDGHGDDCPEWACTVCGLAHVDVVPDPVTPLGLPVRQVPAA